MKRVIQGVPPVSHFNLNPRGSARTGFDSGTPVLQPSPVGVGNQIRYLVEQTVSLSIV